MRHCTLPFGRLSLLATTVIAASVAFAACTPPPIHTDDGGRVDEPILFFDAGPQAPIDTDGGTPTGDGGPGDNDGGPAINEQVGVLSVTPPNGPLVGGNRVRIEGWGFTPGVDEGGDSRVFFGDNEATGVLYLNESLTVFVPPCDEPGPIDVRVENSAGIGLGEGLYTCFSPVTLASVSPATGSTAGGTAITLTGEGFNEDMMVLVGGRQVVGLTVTDENTATAFTPPGVSGRTDVEGLDVFGRSVLKLAFRYVSDLEIDVLEPPAAVAGTVVDVWGAGFDESCTATIGGVSAAVTNLVSELRLRARVPVSLASGTYDVVVSCDGAMATLEEGFFVLPAPSGALGVLAALPSVGDVAGGTLVHLAGDGFTNTTGVTFAGTDVLSFEAQGDRVLLVEIPAGTLGAAQIEVTTSDLGSATFDGFEYVDALAAESMDPAFGPVVGGTPVTLTGRAFVSGMTVTMGGLPVTDLVVTSATEATFTTPPGSSGPADVVVTSGTETARLDDGFLYEADLEVLGVHPSRGGMSGGTYITVRGQGFSRPGALALVLGGQPAIDAVVVSDSLLTARTPIHEPGVVDVTVTKGALEATASRAFTFFNPTFLLGGTRGGPIDGAVYVTVLDAFLGLPVPEIVVFLGTTGEATDQMSVTNVLGQATISGPDVKGPQTVSIVADGWEYASFVDVNASEITVYLQPLLAPPPDPGGQPPPPPPPATIRGRVFGFAKEFFDPAALGPSELAVAFVMVTSRDEFSRPGSTQGVVFNEGGEYFIEQSRPGRVAVVALAGIYNTETDEFRPRQMGVRRPVFPQMGVDLVEQDIELTVPLDEDIDLSLPDAPVGVAGGPTVTRVIPFLRFGGEGSLAYTTAVNTSRNHDLKAMPDVPGEMLTFVAGAYTTDRESLITDAGTVELVQGEPFAFGTGTTWGQVDPFTQIPLVQGGILVVEGPAGQKWATEVVTALDNGTLLLDRKAPFTGTGMLHHIGDPSFPSSVVMQDGVGDLIGGVLIHPVLGLPEPISPADDGVLENRTLRWKPALGQQPTNHLVYVYEAIEFSTLWTFYLDGTRTKAPMPRIPANVGDLPIENVPKEPRLGGYVWQHMSMYVPGFTYNNFSYVDLGSRSRRAWTTNITYFINPGD